MPSIVSGESFFRGFQAAPLSFRFEASFSSCHAGRSIPGLASLLVSGSLFVPNGFTLPAAFTSSRNPHAVEKSRESKQRGVSLAFASEPFRTAVGQRARARSVLRVHV